MAPPTSAELSEAYEDAPLGIRYRSEQEMRKRSQGQRVYRDIQQKIRWTCGKYGSGFPMEDGCQGCGRQRCEGCIRSP
jgi:ribosomal protein S6E (S10)